MQGGIHTASALKVHTEDGRRGVARQLGCGARCAAGLASQGGWVCRRLWTALPPAPPGTSPAAAALSCHTIVESSTRYTNVHLLEPLSVPDSSSRHAGSLTCPFGGAGCAPGAGRRRQALWWLQAPRRLLVSLRCRAVSCARPSRHCDGNAHRWAADRQTVLRLDISRLHTRYRYPSCLCHGTRLSSTHTAVWFGLQYPASGCVMHGVFFLSQKDSWQECCASHLCSRADSQRQLDDQAPATAELLT